MVRLYKIGKSIRHGNIITVPDESLSVIEKIAFYSSIEISLKQFNLQQYKKEATLIKNLKRGVTIGDDYYLIMDIKKIDYYERR